MAEAAAVLGRRPVRTLVLPARGFFIAPWRKREPFAPSLCFGHGRTGAQGVWGHREGLGLEESDTGGMLGG